MARKLNNKKKSRRHEKSNTGQSLEPFDFKTMFGDPVKIEKQISENADKAMKLILSIEPRALLAEQFLRLVMLIYGKGKESEMPYESQIAGRVLEFMNSTYASFLPSKTERLPAFHDIEELWNTVTNLYLETKKFEMIMTKPGQRLFAGGDASEIEFWARANWTSLRRNRYPTHDLPFYRLMLTPHSQLLMEAYSIDLSKVLSGIEAIHNAIHTGPMPHLTSIWETNLSLELKAPGTTPTTNTLEKWSEILAKLPLDAKVQAHVKTLCNAEYLNISKISCWPRSLLEDVAYNRGEVTHFFDNGPRSGWLTKTLPMRRKPFLFLGEDAYAFDMVFSVEAIYRAIQFGIQQRVPNAQTRWDKGQAEVAETVFQNLFAKQLSGAQIIQAVRYKVVGGGGNWAECDCIILIDDTLLVIEAKAGLLGFSPPDEELDTMLDRLKRLTLDAHYQANRFLNYLLSREEACNGQVKPDTFLSHFPIEFPLKNQRRLIA